MDVKLSSLVKKSLHRTLSENFFQVIHQINFQKFKLIIVEISFLTMEIIYCTVRGKPISPLTFNLVIE